MRLGLRYEVTWFRLKGNALLLLEGRMMLLISVLFILSAFTIPIRNLHHEVSYVLDC